MYDSENRLSLDKTLPKYTVHLTKPNTYAPEHEQYLLQKPISKLPTHRFLYTKQKIGCFFTLLELENRICISKPILEFSISILSLFPYLFLNLFQCLRPLDPSNVVSSKK
uniref:Uncharacterized protein n=1 Tax=Cacopsylla melanoneura TaxID=428564 RepID=A0A8D8UPT5_9HEMI